MKVNFSDIADRISDRSLKPLGRGSGRTVFGLTEKYAVKAARNQRGIAQNIAEYEIYSKSRSPILAKALAISEDGKLLIMENTQKISSISEVWRHFKVKSNRGLLKLPELKELSQKHSLILPDLGRAANWGKIKNSVVIIDYGFTKSVKKRYYTFF